MLVVASDRNLFERDPVPRSRVCPNDLDLLIAGDSPLIIA